MVESISAKHQHPPISEEEAVDIMLQEDSRQEQSHTLIEKLQHLRQNDNFYKEEIKIREDFKINVFVRRELYDQRGQLIDPTVLAHQVKEKHTKSGGVVSSQREQEERKILDSSDDEDIDDDPENDEDEDEEDNEVENGAKGTKSSPEQHEDEDIDIEETLITNSFKVDLIAEYGNPSEEIVLHWGISKKNPCEWNSPDDRYLPKETIRFRDGKACQTKFIRDPKTPNLRSIHMNLWWKEAMEPGVKSLSFVLFEQNKNSWYNNNNRDYHIKFDIPSPTSQAATQHSESGAHHHSQIGQIVKEIIECEVEYGSWTLMHRYNKCREILKDRINQENRDHIAYLFIWLRYSFTRQLTWQKSYNTKPKDLQWAQVCLTDEIVSQYSRLYGKEKEHFLTSADLIRLMLGMIGKGSGSGQRVRDDILHIMHKHKIPETAGHFYEQWHQKLHNNTTPDDIPICEALLAYLKSGDLGQYWSVLKANGIDRDRLASYERKITCEPWMKKEAIPDFEEYLNTLKQLHSSGDLTFLSNEARGQVGNDTCNMIDEVLRNFSDSDTLRQMDRVTRLRQNLNQYHLDRGNSKKLKDVLFLDLGLETYFRALTERIMHIDIGFEAYVREVTMILNNLSYSYQWNELAVCREDWELLVQPLARGQIDEDNARKIKSVADRIKQSLGEVTDQMMHVLQAKGELLGKEFQLSESSIKIFSEEVTRGTLFFSLSMILKKIDPKIRESAHLGNWLVVSQGRSHGSRGYVEYVRDLKDVMHKHYERRTVLLCERIDGEEEVPMKIQAIVLIDGTDYPDVLAHVSVRARNLKVMFTVCFDDQIISDLRSLVGKHTFFAIEGNKIRYQEQNPQTPITKSRSSQLLLQLYTEGGKQIREPPEPEKSFVLLKDFNTTNMGAKSNNLRILHSGLQQFINLPKSGCIPFKMLEYTLNIHEEIKEELYNYIERLRKIKSVKKMNRILYRCKDLVLKLEFKSDDPMHAFLKKELIAFGIQEKDFAQAWKTIKMVWASKFNERAFLATKKIGVSLHQVFMAVLVQEIIPADYAYVVHTYNPTNGEENEVYVESCLGLGEALVSKMPGQAFSFTYDKTKQQSHVNAYPNKPIGLKASGFIFRSDSNSEDLPGFAGAGLFDSYPMHETSEFRISYVKERLIQDRNFRINFMNQIAQIGVAIENLYDKQPQDIEGAYYNGKFVVVQTRPQV